MLAYNIFYLELNYYCHANIHEIVKMLLLTFYNIFYLLWLCLNTNFNISKFSNLYTLARLQQRSLFSGEISDELSEDTDFNKAGVPQARKEILLAEFESNKEVNSKVQNTGTNTDSETEWAPGLGTGKKISQDNAWSNFSIKLQKAEYKRKCEEVMKEREEFLNAEYDAVEDKGFDKVNRDRELVHTNPLAWWHVNKEPVNIEEKFPMPPRPDFFNSSTIPTEPNSSEPAPNTNDTTNTDI